MSYFEDILGDLRVPVEQDPAAHGPLDVILSYPGFHAIAAHRLIHEIWKTGVPLLPRYLANLVRFYTGIEIHPAARIGKRFFIDHGMGVVIGETTEIGDDVTLYKGVTLGGTSLGHGKRHPTLGNNVVVGTNASVLGAITLGDGCLVGANSVVVTDVPPGATVVGVPARLVKKAPESTTHISFPDPHAAIVQQLAERIEALERRLADVGLATQPQRAPQLNSAIFDDVSPSI